MQGNRGTRFAALDSLRGLAIVLMALDHANHFVAQGHPGGEHWGGPFPVYSTALAFLTRLVTHLCAPAFFFLMGAGMSLFGAARRTSGWTQRRITAHFWSRGLFLVLLQFAVVNPVWQAGPERFPSVYLGVLAALGGAMALGSLLLRAPTPMLLAAAAGLLVGTELSHPAPEAWESAGTQAWSLVLLRSGGDWNLWSNYPVLPWLELVVFGMLFGRWLLADPPAAYRRALWLGLALLAAFGIVRSLDGFGNIRPRAGPGWIDFLNVVKYPPSWAYTFLTMGINLTALWGLARMRPNGILQRVLGVFGREPLFLYLVHLAVFMLMGRLLAPDGCHPGGSYACWCLGLAMLYPLALWYGGFKGRQPAESVWRYL